MKTTAYAKPNYRQNNNLPPVFKTKELPKDREGWSNEFWAQFMNKAKETVK